MGIVSDIIEKIALFLSIDSKILLANLKQDIELINRDVTGLRSEVEMLKMKMHIIRFQVLQAGHEKNSDLARKRAPLNFKTVYRHLSSPSSKVNGHAGVLMKNLIRKFQQIIEQMNRGFDQVSNQVIQLLKNPLFQTIIQLNGFVHVVEKGRP